MIRRFAAALRSNAPGAMLALLLCSGVTRGDAEIEPLTNFPQAHLAIKTKLGKVHEFDIWVADSPKRQQQGLMFVRDLDAHRGMVFVYAKPARLTMWMKNTLIPLDMLFIDAQGKIVFIEHDATPESLDIIAAPVPARAVVELKGGDSRKFDLLVGDAVSCECLSKQ